MRYFLALLFAIAMPISAAAQDDKNRITQFLEDAFSSEDRVVQIEGFTGALSKRVTMDRLTISDRDGVFLTLTDAVLDWNRTSVLRGQIEINEISAARMELSRIPPSDDSASPEAGTFALPALPVSLRIDKIAVNEVVLGEALVGMPVSVSVAGSVSLIDGQGAANLDLTRLAGPRGSFELDAAFSNETRVLLVDLAMDEAEGGIAATLLNLPGEPALELTVNGNSPIDDFVAEVLLKSEGQERLGGQISTHVPAETDATSDTPTRIIDADISGDLTQLFAPQYHTFFGNEVALTSHISLFDDGRASLDDLSVHSSALQLSGNVALSADHLPEQFSLNIELQDKGGDLVLLPLSGTETWVRSATMNANFDSDMDDTWSLTGILRELQREDASFDEVELIAGGVIQGGDTKIVSARVDGYARGVALSDPDLATAVGSDASFGVDLQWQEEHPLDVSNLLLNAQGLEVSGAGTVEGLGSAMLAQGAFQASVPDLSRFSAISARALSGGLKANLDGQIALLTGAFDLTLDAVATNLGVGIPKVDAALSGDSRLDVSVVRDTEGLTLRNATIATSGGSAVASGILATGNSNLQFQANIQNVGQFVDGLSGAGSIRGDAKHVGDQWVINTQADGPGGTTFTATGQVLADASSADINLNGSLPLALLNQQLSPNSLQGFARFDLQLNGPLSLSSVSGQVRTDGTRMSIPAISNSLEEIAATVNLSGGSAEIQASANVTSGGKLSANGRIGLQAPFGTDISVELDNVKVTDPQLYETNVAGSVRLSGAMPANLSLAGTLVLDETEIRVPTTGMTAFGEIPDIVHLNEPAPVRRTRYFAGLLGDGDTAVGGGVNVALDLQFIAENRIFIRGRGLDAELGGQLRLTGTTNNVIPQGQFSLVRGRLDILGKRLVLEEGWAKLQGDMQPTIRLVAQTTADDIVVSVIVEGSADAPEIRFTSDPELPEDEVLARLLFGRDVTSISAFQAVQLASAVATLAGRGGVGIVERLRANTGFDNLDLTTDDEGATSLSVGKYINENLYTDVEIDSEGQSQINLNLTLSPSTKLRGQVDSDGDTGIGLFFERDY